MECTITSYRMMFNVSRLNNSREEEIAAGMEEVKKIATLRAEDVLLLHSSQSKL